VTAAAAAAAAASRQHSSIALLHVDVECVKRVHQDTLRHLQYALAHHADEACLYPKIAEDIVCALVICALVILLCFYTTMLWWLRA
jgi:hypothetical protein